MRQREKVVKQGEIVFVVIDSPQGGFEASAVGHSIYTQADTWGRLKAMARDAVGCHFEPADRPSRIHLHLIRDEWIVL